jgi:plasmid stabilization system protein ParE
MAEPKVFLQSVSSASADPPRRWLADGTAHTGRWDEIEPNDIVLCCTTDDVRHPAGYIERFTKARSKFSEDMTFTALRTRLDALYGRVSARVPETKATLVSGPLLAATSRRSEKDVDVVVIVHGRALGVAGYSRSVVAFSFDENGEVNTEMLDAVRDYESLVTNITANAGSTFKWLSESHDRAVTMGTRQGSFPGVDMQRVKIVENDEVEKLAIELKKFAYVTSFKKQRTSTRQRYGVAGIVAASACGAGAYGFYLQQQTASMESQIAELRAKSVQLAKDTDLWIAERPHAYARSLSLDLPAVLQRARQLAVQSIGSRVVLTSTSGRVRYDVVEDREIVLTPNATVGSAGAAVVYRTSRELINALRVPVQPNVTQSTGSIANDGSRYLRTYHDEKASPTFTESIVRSAGL